MNYADNNRIGDDGAVVVARIQPNLIDIGMEDCTIGWEGVSAAV